MEALEKKSFLKIQTSSNFLAILDPNESFRKVI